MNEALTTKGKKKKYFFWGFFLLVGCALTVLFVILYFSPRAHAHRIFKRVQTTIDPERLRTWAEQEAKHPERSPLSAEDIPEGLAKLEAYPPTVNIGSAQNSRDKPFVVLMWGGGFFHWGMFIGSTNYLLEPNPQAFHDVKWVDGIYFRHEGTASP